MHTHKYVSVPIIVVVILIASDLTIRVMHVLALILKDHKAQPVTEKLLSFIPVSTKII